MTARRVTGKYLACLQCRRVFPSSELEKEMLNWENLHIELDKFLG